MKKFFGGALQVLSYLIMSVSYSIPLSILAVYFLKTLGVAEGVIGITVAALAISLLVFFACSRIKIPRYRVVWALLFGLGTYLIFGFFAVFGFAKGTEAVYAGFGIKLGNDLLAYIGAGAMTIGIVLAAEGRYLVRDSDRIVPVKRPVAPKIKSDPAILKAVRSAPIILTQVPDPNLAPDETCTLFSAIRKTAGDPETEAATKSEGEPEVFDIVPAATQKEGAHARYVRDERGNLVAYEDIPPRTELPS